MKVSIFSSNLLKANVELPDGSIRRLSLSAFGLMRIFYPKWMDAVLVAEAERWLAFEQQKGLVPHCWDE
jgi:hypothetical protein